MGGELVAVTVGEFSDELFKPRCSLEIDKLAAADAHQVVMMGFERFGQLVPLFEADLNDVDDAEFSKKLQGSIHAGALGKLAGADDFLQHKRLIPGFEDRKDVSARFSKAKLAVSKELFESFHVASIRSVATHLQQAERMRYTFGHERKRLMAYWYMVAAIVVGSAISLVGGATIFLAKKKRSHAITIALPFGAGALLAAAFFDLLPESFELGSPKTLLAWALAGFLAFFVMERSATWFHHHHEHKLGVKNKSQGAMVMIGDLLHNMIDGVAIGAAFLVNPAAGFITTLAVSAHEIPKELGTFGILLSRGWKDKKVMLANIATAVGTLLAASLTFALGSTVQIPVAELLALTSGFFIYIAASDIIPDIHEQPRKIGTLQAVILLLGVLFVATAVQLLGV